MPFLFSPVSNFWAVAEGVTGDIDTACYQYCSDRRPIHPWSLFLTTLKKKKKKPDKQKTDRHFEFTDLYLGQF